MEQLYTSCLNRAIYKPNPNISLQVKSKPRWFFFVLVLWDLLWLDYKELKRNLKKAQSEPVSCHLKKGHSSENVAIQSRLKLHLFEKGKEMFNIDVKSSQVSQMSF